MSLDKALLKCARCKKSFVILNLFNNRWVCLRCYKDLKQLSHEFDYAKTRVINPK